MALVLAHLCDVHINTADDPVLGRTRAIGEAIAAEAEAHKDTVILLVGGDAAYSGLQSQFDLAKRFFGDIRNTIAEKLGTDQVHCIIVPGNHDCDLGGDQTARDMVLKSFSVGDAEKASVLPLIMRPLQDYFAFAAELAGSGNCHTHQQPWYRAVEISHGETQVRLHLFNSAWMSAREERTNTLLFPMDCIQPPLSAATYSVSLLHHPFNWFRQPESMRPLRQRIEELSDLIFLGHEHDAGTHTSTSVSGTSALYIEGGALHDADNSESCGFLCVKLDFDNKKQSIARLKWATEGFFKHQDEVREDPLHRNPRRADVKYDLAPAFIESLNDPGVPIHHPHREHVTLRDIFMFPDLWELDKGHNREFRKQVKSGRVAGTIFERAHILITGGEKSGKTCLAKSLFIEAKDRGLVPLLVSGAELGTKKPPAVRKELRRLVKEQYRNLDPDEFEQLPLKKKVLVIDDIQELSDSRARRKETLEFLKGHCGSIMAIGQEFFCLQELTGESRKESGLWDFDHFVILGFGELLREDFIRRWLTLGGEAEPDSCPLEERVHHTIELLRQVIRQHLIPCYPLFIIVILQQAGLGQPLMQGGSYGHLFHAIVTALLSKSRYETLSIKDKYTYLSALAFHLYTCRQASMPERDLSAWHRSYWCEIGVDVPFDRLLSDLVELSMLRTDAGAVSFRYKYNYCFFVAYFISENLHDPSIRNLIPGLFQKLYHVESSEIVLFLAHLSNDPLVMEEMIHTAEKLLAEAPLANMVEDVKPINQLGQTMPKLVLPPGDPEERRRKMLEERDDKPGQRDPAQAEGHLLTPAPDSDPDVITKQYMNIHASFKTIQILGQALRNNAGSMKLTDKERVIDQVFKLARRLLGMYFSIFGAELPGLAEDLAEAIRHEDPDVLNDALIQQISMHLWRMSELVGFVVARHVSNSIGAELLDTAVSRVLDQDCALPNQVFELSIDLDRPGRFPKDRAIAMHKDLAKNPYVQTLVRLLVGHHLYLYNVRFDIKQSICSQLDISLPASTLDQDRKLLK